MLGARGTARHRGGNSRHRAPAEAARAFSSGCSGGAAASIWAAAAFTPRRFASVKLLARASFRHHGVCSQTRTRQMLSGGWVQMPDAQKRGARAGHARALVRVVQARRSPLGRRFRGLRVTGSGGAAVAFAASRPAALSSPSRGCGGPPCGGVCLPSRRGAAASPVGSFRGWCVASLKAPRKQLLALEEFFTRSRKILL